MKTSEMRNLILFSLLGLVCACSLWGPLRVDKGAKDYSIDKTLKDWTVKTNWEEADYLYSNKTSSAFITVSSLCDRYEIASLESLSKSALSPLKDREILKSETRIIDEREALTKKLMGKLDGVEVEVVFTVLRKGDCIFDFYLTSYHQAKEDDVKDYERLLKSFHYKGY